MGYKQATASEQILVEFPGLTQEELDEVNGLFRPYVFFENVPEGRRVWTNCCHVEGELVKHVDRTETQADRCVLQLGHNEGVTCPYCGRPAIAKNRRKIGKGKGIEEYIPVLFLRSSEDGETIYAQGYWAHKDFSFAPASYPEYMPTNAYRFRRGEALQWGRMVFSENNPWRMEPQGGKWITDPFTDGGGYYSRYCGYRIIGLEEIERSFLRYVGLESCLTKTDQDLWSYCRKRTNLMRFMALAARYPENVEMLVKAGMHDAIRDWVYCKKKNAKAISWGKADPREAFGLNTQELRAFLASDRNLDVLALYKTARKQDGKVTLSDVSRLIDDLNLPLATDIVRRLKRLPGLRLNRLMKYLNSFAGPRCHGGGVTLEFVAQCWRDYMDAAIALKYDLSNPIIQTPRELEQAHDKATKSYAAVILEKAKKDADGRYKSLQSRYGFEFDQYFIRAPFSTEEIVAEGKALKHCVAGYANRHATGKLSILFLREKARPNKPLVTIEIFGSDMRQIQGKGNSVPARKLYATILEPWLAWVAAGSKRDKDGRPRMPKPKIHKVA